MRIMVMTRWVFCTLARATRLGLSHFQGEDMAPKTATRAKPEPIVTVDDIDEALTHTSRSLNRDEHWQRWTDALLDQRLRLAKPSREIRVMPIDETRGGH